MTVYDQTSRRPIKRYAMCGKCGSKQFVLNKDQVALSNWTFSCAACGTRHPDPWIDKCDETLGRIAANIVPGGNIVGEASMEKINYAASAAYFVRSDTFITFPEGSGIEALEPGQAHLLPQAIERMIGLEGAPLSDDDIKAQLAEKQRTSEAADFDGILSGLKLATDNNNAAVVALMNNMKSEKISSWSKSGWLNRKGALPSNILDKLNHRHEWSGKYDPFRLVVEHAALSRTKLQGDIVSGRASYVDFDKPDEWLVPPSSCEKYAMVDSARRARRHLGLARGGLITKFDLCKFSYGYSRVENGPRVLKHGRMMPVRLRLFEKVRAGQEALHPVYVLEQSNEAYYFKLDEALVRAWLAQKQLGCSDVSLLTQFGGNFAAAMLGSAELMNGYLENHERKTSSTV